MKKEMWREQYDELIDMTKKIGNVSVKWSKVCEMLCIVLMDSGTLDYITEHINGYLNYHQANAHFDAFYHDMILENTGSATISTLGTVEARTVVWAMMNCIDAVWMTIPDIELKDREIRSQLFDIKGSAITCGIRRELRQQFSLFIKNEAENDEMLASVAFCKILDIAADYATECTRDYIKERREVVFNTDLN